MFFPLRSIQAVVSSWRGLATWGTLGMVGFPLYWFAASWEGPPPVRPTGTLAQLEEEVVLEGIYQGVVALDPRMVDSETLWLARVIYSETKRASEQELVAWVVRNRVETGYRGERTYVGTALDPLQFSAFNRSNQRRSYYAGLTAFAGAPGWQEALRIAYYVRHAPSERRPFSITTRHFYSEQSMKGRLHPEWSEGRRPIAPPADFEIEPRRFRFFDDIA
ncbi:MAG: hypothetical protein EB075_08840 [Bacteroidetes bacterium]|nr:hypothetical protein [Bacteroidota bacterium]